MGVNPEYVHLYRQFLFLTSSKECPAMPYAHCDPETWDPGHVLCYHLVSGEETEAWGGGRKFQSFAGKGQNVLFQSDFLL